MRRDDVPKEDVLDQLELGESTMDDRRRRLCWPCTGELTLRRERDAGDARAPIPRRLADDKETRVTACHEVCRQPFPQAVGVSVLIERSPDPSRGELFHECARRYDGPSVTGSSGQPG